MWHAKHRFESYCICSTASSYLNIPANQSTPSIKRWEYGKLQHPNSISRIVKTHRNWSTQKVEISNHQVSMGARACYPHSPPHGRTCRIDVSPCLGGSLTVTVRWYQLGISRNCGCVYNICVFFLRGLLSPEFWRLYYCKLYMWAFFLGIMYRYSN